VPTAPNRPVGPTAGFARLGELHPTQTVEQQLTAQLGDLALFYPDLFHKKRLALLLDGLNEPGRRTLSMPPRRGFGIGVGKPTCWWRSPAAS
jgi:hypothetical protein